MLLSLSDIHCIIPLFYKSGNFVLFRHQFVSVKFMKKYLHVAKEVKPQMTREAADFIAEEYSKLRNQDMGQDNLAKVSQRMKCFLTLIIFNHTNDDVLHWKVMKYGPE